MKCRWKLFVLFFTLNLTRNLEQRLHLPEANLMLPHPVCMVASSTVVFPFIQSVALTTFQKHIGCFQVYISLHFSEYCHFSRWRIKSYWPLTIICPGVSSKNNQSLCRKYGQHENQNFKRNHVGHVETCRILLLLHSILKGKWSTVAHSRYWQVCPHTMGSKKHRFVGENPWPDPDNKLLVPCVKCKYYGDHLFNIFSCFMLRAGQIVTKT